MSNLYDAAFRAERRAVQDRMTAGEVFTCPRCKREIVPGDPFELDHYQGLLLASHPSCNSSAGGKKAAQRRRRAKRRAMKQTSEHQL